MQPQKSTKFGTSPSLGVQAHTPCPTSNLPLPPASTKIWIPTRIEYIDILPDTLNNLVYAKASRIGF